MQSPHTSTHWLRTVVLTVAVSAWAGVVIGLWAGYLTTTTNHTLAPSGSALAFALVVAAAYAALFAAAGLVASLIARVVAPRLCAWCASSRLLRWLPISVLPIIAALLVFALHRIDARVRTRPDPPPVISTNTSTNTGAQVIVIGLDGADWRRIRALIAQGRLPAFATLTRGGVASPLTTEHPTLSPILWTTIATGMGASAHGVFTFTERPIPGLGCGIQKLARPHTLPRHVGLRPLVRTLINHGWFPQTAVSSCHRHVKALWNILSDQGRRVGVVNWWATWPSEPVNGFMVSDNSPLRAAFIANHFNTTAPPTFGTTYPESLMTELSTLVDSAALTLPAEALSLPFFADLTNREREELTPQDVQFFWKVLSSDRFSAAAGLQLLNKERLDFLALYLSGIDNISHRFAFKRGMVDRYYEFVDGVLYDYLQRADEQTTLVILSDHGWDYEHDGLFGHFHGPDGVLLLYGRAVQPGAELRDKPSLYEIAPTVLALLGLPQSREMPGYVLTEALQPASRTAVAATPVVSYGAHTPPARLRNRTSAQLGDETMEKLRALGYVK